MAGPSLVVRVLGDLSGLGKAFEQAGSTAQSGVSKIHSAFSGMLGTLNQTGVLGPFEGALNAVDQGLGALAEHGKSVSTTMMGVGGAMAGLGAGLMAVSSKEQASHQQLQAAIEATGNSYEDYGGQISASIKHMETFGFTAGKTDDALRVLTQATHDPQKALDLLGTAANVAKAKHEDLNTAATQIGRVFNGNTKLLKEYGIVIDKNTGLTKDGKTATEALAQVTAGQAAAATDTFMGRLDGLKAKITDAVSQFGQKYGPAITAAGTAMAGLGATMQVVSALGPIMGAAMELALGPVGLIILAIAALGVAAYAIYRNWDTIWAAMQAAVAAVWNFIQTYWPLLLPILLGPIGLFIDFVVKNWGTITAVIAGAWNWIATYWPLLLDILLGPFGFLLGWVINNRGTVTAVVAGLWHWIADNWPLLAGILTGPFGLAVYFIVSNWSGIVGFFAGLVAGIAGAFADVERIVSAPFIAGWNAIAAAWNDTVGQLNFKVPDWVPGLGGKGFGMPKIPTMAAGGIVTSPTLALIGERGPEAVVPLGRGGIGPAVHIENVNVTDGADVDLLLSKIRFAAQAATL